MSNILLYVSGSVAAYKACELTSLLKKKDFDVRVILSDSAKNFVGEATFQALTHHKVHWSLFDDDFEIPHITLAQKWADLIIAYPASANCINRLSCGLADDFFGAVFLANNFKKPVLISPAMNTQMFLHPAVQDSLEKLKKWGCKILPCEEGILACGEKGSGKLISADKAFVFILEALK